MADLRERASSGVVHLTDLAVAAVLIGGSLWLWSVANGFEETPDLFSQNIAPDLFPKLLLVCIIALSLTLPFEHLFLKGGRERLDSGRKSPIKPRAYIIGGIIILILAALPYIGTILTLFATSLAMPLIWGERRFFLVAAFAALFPAAVVALFGLFLKVHMDPGVYGVGLY